MKLGDTMKIENTNFAVMDPIRIPPTKPFNTIQRIKVMTIMFNKCKL